MPLTGAKLKARIKEDTYKTWENRWSNETTCHQTRLILPSPTPSVAKYIFTVDRWNCSIMVQFISGHNYLRYHLFNTGKSLTSLCRTCEEKDETAWHLLTDCPAQAHPRMMCFYAEERMSPPRMPALHRYLTTFITHLLRYPTNVTG